MVVDDQCRITCLANGTDPDELQLKRTPITFLVPRRLRRRLDPARPRCWFAACSSATAGRLVCEVTELKPVTGDLDRLERGLASLSAKDFETRKAWARWAERRASDFKDDALLKRAREPGG